MISADENVVPGRSGAKKYLITGGAGFLGSSLVRRLVLAGCYVRVFDNQSRGKVARLDDIRGDFEFVEGDVRDVQAVQHAMKGIDCVWHFAFVNGTEFFYTHPELVLEVGVKGIIHVLDACLKYGVGEFFFASSSEVYHNPPYLPADERVPMSIPDPLNPRYSYSAGKMISEMMAIHYGRKHFERVVVFRPHNVYGPDMGWQHVVPQFVLRMRELCRGAANPVRFPIQGTGKETRSLTYIEDFIQAAWLLKERGEHLGIYHVGTPEEITVETIAREVGRYFRREIAIKPGELAPGSVVRRCPDITKLKKLGYDPKVFFLEGLPIVAKWYDENADKRPSSGF